MKSSLVRVTGTGTSETPASAPLPLAGVGGGQIVTSFRGATLAPSVFVGPEVVAGDFADTALAEGGLATGGSGLQAPTARR